MLRVAAVVPNPDKIRAFRSQALFEAWLSKNHDRETELWIKFHKKASGLETVVYKEALDVSLCWGWIDGLVKTFDENSYIQRFTPRKGKSLWSQINRENVARLVAAGRMTEHGLRHVEAAKKDGRWDAAYASPSKMELPDDLATAIAKNAKAAATLATFDKQSRYGLAFRVGNLKTPAARTKKIAEFVAALAEGGNPIKGVAASTAAPAGKKTAAPAKKATAAKKPKG